MAFDAHKNLAIGTVVTAPSPPTTGTSVTVGAGEGARFPAVPFNGTVWAADMAPDPTTAEVWRCTARAGDVLTLVRAQEGTTARAIVAGDLIAATITAKSLTDIESGVNFPLIQTPGELIFTGAGVIRTDDTAGADAQYLHLTGSGAVGRGAYINLMGKDYPGQANEMQLVSTTAGVGGIKFQLAGAAGKMHPSGGFSWGGTTDPGAGNLSVQGNVVLSGAAGAIHASTPDGGDLNSISLGGGGAAAPSRGGYALIYGNESGGVNGGKFVIGAGESAANGTIDFYTAPGYSLRGRIHASGGFSWGGTTDPGAGAFAVGASLTAGQNFVAVYPGSITMSTAVATATNLQLFYTPSGFAGYIQTTGTTTAYGTTSDARLKTPLGRHTDPEVLRRTVIHDFVWKTDGTPGRGVFAQEAQLVAPFAVSVGTDDVDAEGRLTKPWGVDYSKYVPDLITGWQSHDGELTQHQAELAKLRADVAVLITRLAWPPARSVDRPPSVYQRIRAAMARWFPAWITP